jgi:hypothetical protein
MRKLYLRSGHISPNYMLLGLFTIAFAGCKGSPPQGSERGQCYGNGTCNAGLTCLSEVCVAAGAATMKAGAGSAAPVPAATPRDLNAKATDAVPLDAARKRYAILSDKTEATLQLNKIGKNAKRNYTEAGSFIVGGTGLMPRSPCCQGPDHHCPANPGAWAADEAWRVLDFQIDEPSLFQYSYRSSDGKTFTAEAIGDLDCDGSTITFRLEGSIIHGEPVVTLTEPPADAY